MKVRIFSKGFSVETLNPPLFPYMVQEFDALCTIKLKQKIIVCDRTYVPYVY